MKIIFQKWFNKNNKQISLISYKDSWSQNGTGRIYRIRNNGAKRKNGDKCFDFYIECGYLVFNYTNFNLQSTPHKPNYMNGRLE
jgi:hypothetical protein